MSIKEIGDGLKSWWPVVTTLVGAIALTGIAYATISDLSKRVEKAETRFQRIEWYLIRIGEKVGVGFGE